MSNLKNCDDKTNKSLGKNFKKLYLQILSIFQESQPETRNKLRQRTPQKQPKKTIILVLEDDKYLQQGLKMMLQGLPYKVAVASNGKEGLDYLRKHGGKVAFILLDIMMPIMDGSEFLSIVKKDSELKEIPVIIQSGSSDKIIQECMAKGANGYIQKPYTKEMLYASIKEVNIKRGGKNGKRIMQGACTGF